MPHINVEFNITCIEVGNSRGLDHDVVHVLLGWCESKTHVMFTYLYP